MITKLSGKLIHLADEAATLEVAPYEYEVLIPDFTRRQLQMKVGEKVSLHTVQYIDGNVQKGGRMTPRLIGFDSVIEREFFELFCSVSGVGVRKALRAMVRPVQDLARAIEQQDINSVKTLPGIGPSTAEKICATLRRKMAKFALMVPKSADGSDAEFERNIIDETYQILLTLGHSESEARKLLEVPLSKKKEFKDVDALLQAVYDNNS